MRLTIGLRKTYAPARCACEAWLLSLCVRQMNTSRLPSVTVPVAILLIVGHCIAATPKPACKGNPQLVGDCYFIRGRVSFYNGNPSYRIWIIGTKRLLGLSEHWGSITPRDWPIVPENLSNLRNRYDDVFGNFVVYPFTKYTPGWMQFVCVESASDLVFVTRDKKGKKIAEGIRRGNRSERSLVVWFADIV